MVERLTTLLLARSAQEEVQDSVRRHGEADGPAGRGTEEVHGQAEGEGQRQGEEDDQNILLSTNS